LLDLNLKIINNTITSSLFDERDNFDFPTVSFPNLSGNIPHAQSYGVFSGELVRYARACTHIKDFNARTVLLVKKLTSQHFLRKSLIHSFKKFCSRHILLIQKYGKAILTSFTSWPT
jgi:hypothetical protein